MIMPVQDGRIYLPPEDESKPHERVVMHPETNSHQVIMPDNRYLEDFLGAQPIVSAERPTATNVLWLQITATRS